MAGAWATWKRVWDGYQFDVAGITEPLVSKLMSGNISIKRIRQAKIKLWKRTYSLVKQNQKISYWDVQFGFLKFYQSYLTVVPKFSIASNIGSVSYTHLDVYKRQATKKSNELMAHCYSKLYDIPTTGLRFFTVYGPMGRPDMAYFSFTKKILNGETISIFNNGNMERDFTYIDDIVTGIENILCNPPKENEDGVKYKIYNIGNNKPEKLMDYIECLEKALSKAYGREVKAEKRFLPMQPGDVPRTYADVSELEHDFGFKPDTSIQEGLQKFADWYKEFYG